ncbi:YciI family protein [Actinomycetota bacterium]
MTQYAILIVGDADRWWTTMTPEQRAEGYATYGRFSQELAERGHRIVGGAELHATTEARSIRAAGAPVTDGPFAESVEQVGGFFQVETDDLDGLMECCRILTEIGEGIEVRRVVTDEDRS